MVFKDLMDTWPTSSLDQAQMVYDLYRFRHVIHNARSIVDEFYEVVSAERLNDAIDAKLKSVEKLSFGFAPPKRHKLEPDDRQLVIEDVKELVEDASMSHSRKCTEDRLKAMALVLLHYTDMEKYRARVQTALEQLE